MPTYTANYNLPKPNVNSADDEDLWGGQLNDGMDIIDAQMKANADAIAAFQGAPTGVIFDWPAAVAPSGYLLCFGQEVSRTTYAALFGVIGTVYGIGDGSTTFALPDLRGRVVAGKDDMGGTSADRLTAQTGGVDGDTLGATGGEEENTLTEAQMPEHDHAVLNTFLGIVAGSGGGLAVGLGGGIASAGTNTAGSSEAHNNVQPTIVLNKIIKW